MVPPFILRMGVGILLTAIALGAIAMSLPLIQGKVPLNRVYGVRTRDSLSSETAWYAINAYGGKRMVLWMALLAVYGLLYIVLPFQGTVSEGLGVVIPSTLAALMPAVESIRYGRRYMREHVGLESCD